MDTLKPQHDDGWNAALAIIERLRAEGYEAVLAGGCVRDRLLGLTPKDYDVATSAHPEKVLQLYPKARPVGVKFGVVLVRQNRQDIEVATFRSDGPYTDGRRPDHIAYGSAQQDARRRDFTINGLFLDPATNNVIDYVGGQEDLRSGIIRTIGSAAQRFAEDHLRMLRAVRFAARLAFTIEESTFAEIRTLAPRLNLISPERIAMELAGILVPVTRSIGWNLLGGAELCQYLVPTWKPNAAEQSRVLARLTALPAESIDFSLALAALWSDHAPPAARTHARQLRCSNREVRAVAWLISKLTDFRHPEQLTLAAIKRLRADADWPLLAPLARSVFAAEGTDLGPISRILNQAASITDERIAPPPLLTGNDLQALGVPAGRTLGDLMDRLYTAQLNEEITERAQAEALVRRWILDGNGPTN